MSSSDWSDTEHVGQITITEDIPRQYVDDILCTALDSGYGGSLYWLADIKCNNRRKDEVDYMFEEVSRGYTLLLTNIDGQTNFLGLKEFLFGLEMTCKHYSLTAQALYDDHDATIADLVVQYGIYGKVIYG